MLGTRKIRAEFADLRREEAAQHAATQALIEELARRADEDRQLNREILRRHEIVTRELIDAIGELKAESRAHTRAIFTLIDRLGNGPSPASGNA